MKSASDKLEMYKAVEAVCIAHHQSWNNIKGFGSALSRFVTKVTRLDLVSNAGQMDNEQTIQQLIHEIDVYLQLHIDRFVDRSCTLSSPFCSSYQVVRAQINN